MRWLLAGLVALALNLGAPLVHTPSVARRTLATHPSTVLFLHGFALGSVADCDGFAPLRHTLGEPVVVVGLYGADVHCDRPGLDRATSGTSIEQLAAHVANVAAAIPGPVDLVGHSMGGLIAEVAGRDLPAGKVHRVVTIATPYAGARLDLACPSGRPRECQEMRLNSTFSRHLDVSADLCIGSSTDELVPLSSAIVGGCHDHLVVTGPDHGQVLFDPVVTRAIRLLLR